MTKTQFGLLALMALAFTSCAGMTAAEVTTLSVTGAGALVGFVDALRPMLSPEQAAKLTTIAGDVNTVVDAVTAAVSQVATSVAEIKTAQAEQAAGSWSTGEIAGGTGIVAGLTTVGNRVLSHFKHKTPPPVA